MLAMWGVIPHSEIADEQRCQLLGPFALLVQSLMGVIAILSLVVKRNREYPQRPWKIWLFDVMKQVFGAAGLHFLNVLASILFSESGEPDLDRNPCTWYFLNVLVDTTIGVPVLWFFLFIVHTVAYRLNVREIVSGQYGHPPRWRAFFKQAVLYLIALILMKIMLYAFFWWMPFVDELGQFLISWTDFSPVLQVTFVMMLFPLVMNTLQYYLVDSIIQSPEYHHSKSIQEVSDSSPSYGTL
ncbi:hypothetical protein TRVA0_035S00364 [Trichomonascus vanleenenianus]|uniref:uncharacterized protein n=1 Tax=Trichomonascus vanleenenianus TaxID=2268995 RepID=UPI003ECB0D07